MCWLPLRNVRRSDGPGPVGLRLGPAQWLFPRPSLLLGPQTKTQPSTLCLDIFTSSSSFNLHRIKCTNPRYIAQCILTNMYIHLSTTQIKAIDPFQGPRKSTCPFCCLIFKESYAYFTHDDTKHSPWSYLLSLSLGSLTNSSHNPSLPLATLATAGR